MFDRVIAYVFIILCVLVITCSLAVLDTYHTEYTWNECIHTEFISEKCDDIEIMMMRKEVEELYNKEYN